MKRDFLKILDFTTEDINNTFDIAVQMKANPEKFANTLKGKTLALIFEKPSLRTRTSFDIGIQQLGGYSLYLSPAEINLGKRESVYDVSMVLDRMVQGIMIRTFGHDIVDSMASYTTIPIINGLTDYEHPCQAMADFMTIKELKNSFKGLKLAYIGDGNNVAHSLMNCGARLGAHVVVTTPKGYEPEKKSFSEANEAARLTGAKIEYVFNPFDAVKDADVVYTDTWASMGQEDEAEKRRNVFKDYQVNSKLMSIAKPDALFMHCLPAHRNEEVTDEVIDSKQSVVFQEAENRLHVQKAIMYKLMK